MQARLTCNPAGTKIQWCPRRPIISLDSVNPELEKVVIAELPVLYRVARRLTRHSQEAEDLVGQVLLRAARGWHTFDGRHARSWMITILRNEYCGMKRHQASAPAPATLEDQDIAWCGSVFTEVLGKISTEQLISAMEHLPDDSRLVVVLCDIEGMSYEDAARSLEVPIGTVRSRLFRARKMLQQRMSHLVAPSG